MGPLLAPWADGRESCNGRRGEEQFARERLEGGGAQEHDRLDQEASSGHTRRRKDGEGKA